MICQGCRVPHEGPERCSAPLSCTCQHRLVRIFTPEVPDPVSENAPFAVEVSPEEFDKLARLANGDES